MINGIKTKLVRSEGYWRLLIADHKEAQELAKQVPAYRKGQDFYGKDMVLATMTRYDFIHDRPNWQIQDWRIAPDNEVISPWLCSNHHSETFVHERWINTSELKKITDTLRNVKFGGSFESGGKTFHRIEWNNYRGVAMTEDIERYWADFKGKSIMDGKQPNPFESRSVSDAIMSFSSLEV